MNYGIYWEQNHMMARPIAEVFVIIAQDAHACLDGIAFGWQCNKIQYLSSQVGSPFHMYDQLSEPFLMVSCLSAGLGSTLN